MTVRPIVGIAALSSANVKGLRYSASVVADQVILSVVRAGGDPVLLPPTVDMSGPESSVWDCLDALVVPGGPDVDPARYGQEPAESYVGTDYAEQDDADARAITVAEGRGLPVLLICRAMQLWNVERGGDLVQHWPSEPQDHVGTVHHVTVESGSLLAHALGLSAAEHTVTVSSYHHQAIGVLAAGLRVAARSEDGAIEAIEDSRRRILAVQWHPEDRSLQVKSDHALFAWLVDEARGNRSLRHRADNSA